MKKNEAEMTFKIHFDLPNGTEDSIVLSGKTVEKIREKAIAELRKRGGENSWSEEVYD